MDDTLVRSIPPQLHRTPFSPNGFPRTPSGFASRTYGKQAVFYVFSCPYYTAQDGQPHGAAPAQLLPREVLSIIRSYSSKPLPARPHKCDTIADMKRLILLLPLLAALLFPAPPLTASAVDGRYAVCEQDVWFYAGASEEERLFLIPDTYYVRVLEEGEEVFVFLVALFVFFLFLCLLIFLC